jgi:hypothetical protein
MRVGVIGGLVSVALEIGWTLAMRPAIGPDSAFDAAGGFVMGVVVWLAAGYVASGGVNVRSGSVAAVLALAVDTLLANSVVPIFIPNFVSWDGTEQWVPAATVLLGLVVAAAAGALGAVIAKFRRGHVMGKRPRALKWTDVDAPAVAIRSPGSDGLEIRVRKATVREPDYGDFAVAEVTTIAEGEAKRHDDHLLIGDEAGNLAGALWSALKKPQSDRTVALFDDGLTLRIEGDGAGRWTVACRPVPLPDPPDAWKTFPVYSFSLDAAALERAAVELERLSQFLAGVREPMKSRGDHVGRGTTDLR